ncbi:MAG: response regulator [Phycisphaerae bacterium]|nr:response regulator [Phycisphaerae bacterium]
MALNILVVDDSSITRAMIIKTLKMTGLPLGEIHQASNGWEGLAQLEKQNIDLALVDINMPVMNGEEMIETLRSNPKWASLPVIVVSTEGSRTRIERFQRLDAKFVHKPFSPEVVCQTIEQITGQRYVSQPSDTEF